MNDVISQLSEQLGERLRALGLRLTTAESCTGGGIAEAITRVAGSSSWFEYGFVTYSNSAKQALLGVDGELFSRCGAVSEEVVLAMAAGARRNAGADLAVAVSGVAGPGGGTAAKPVGTVWMAWAAADSVTARRFQFDGDRQAVRQQSVVAALEGLLNLV